MAWKELLQLHDAQERSGPLPNGGESRDKGSLIRQVGEIFGQTGGETNAADGGAELPPPVYQDGYVRRSPVQPYQTAADYRRRRVRKAVTALVILIMAVLLVFALMRSGFLVFRLR